MAPPIAYIHGFIGRLDVPELTDAFEPGSAIAPDLLGYGAFASDPPRLISVDQQALHLRTQIEASFGDAPVVLVGHSGGAAIGVNYILHNPDRVAAFVSAEGNLAASNSFLSSKLAAMTTAQVAEWLERARLDPVHGLGLGLARQNMRPDHVAALRRWLNHQPAPVIHNAARALLSETIRPGYTTDVEKVMRSVPTYLICGEYSAQGLDAPPSVRKLAVDFHTVARAGHTMLLESPAEVAQYIAAIRDSFAPAKRRQ